MNKPPRTTRYSTFAVLILIAAGTANAQAPSNGVAKTKGLMIGAHVNGSTIASAEQDNSASDKERASGGGGGVIVGWGFTKWLMVYAGADVAKVKIRGGTGVDTDNEQPDYTLVHGDIGARFSFPSPNHGFVPYLNAAVTRRSASTNLENQDVSVFGNGVSVGGGSQYFFTPRWALDAGVQFSPGKLGKAKVDGVKYDLKKLGQDPDNVNSVRINVGMKFYPHIRMK